MFSYTKKVTINIREIQWINFFFVIGYKYVLLTNLEHNLSTRDMHHACTQLAKIKLNNMRC